MAKTVGVDIGTGAVKIVLYDIDGDTNTCLDKKVQRVRQRDPFQLAEQTLDEILERNTLKREDLAYIATTGEAETVTFATGHFYSMTTHGRGGIHLDSKARAVLDVGALHGRAIKIDERGKVETYRMTSQCASGSGQFLENIARYLGISQAEIGSLSKQGDNPEKVSGICAVLAETDVINMVSRGISAPNILKGIHVSMAGRLVKLLKGIKVTEGDVLMTGGLALDEGMVAAVAEALVEQKMTGVTVTSHPDSIFAGAMGAAIWGGFRYEKLRKMGQPLLQTA